jgi:AP-2 complex subunit mu-1
MRYRAAASQHPFRIIPNIVEAGKHKLVVNLRLSSEFPEDKKALNLVIKIPVPTSTANARIATLMKGRARYEPGERALVWRIGSMQGCEEATFSAEVDLLPATRDKVWVRPPISMDFRIPMYAASGVQVRFLKVYEKKNAYQTQRWVQYESKAGEYQVRI